MLPPPFQRTNETAHPGRTHRTFQMLPELVIFLGFTFWLWNDTINYRQNHFFFFSILAGGVLTSVHPHHKPFINPVV